MGKQLKKYFVQNEGKDIEVYVIGETVHSYQIRTRSGQVTWVRKELVKEQLNG